MRIPPTVSIVNVYFSLVRRKKFGIQFFLDVIRQYYASPENMNPDDAVAVRAALLEIVKIFIQRDLNIKEICVIVAYIASVTLEHLIIEMLELLIGQVGNKSCKDQLLLLLHEPQTAELCYALLTDRKYSQKMHSLLLQVIPDQC